MTNDREMEPLQLYELHKICRICLKNDLLVSIFSPAPPTHLFMVRPRPIEMIEKLRIFKLQPDDNLPTLLCQSCLYRLLDAYNFQQLAEASERRLREYLLGTSSIDSGNSACAINLNTINQESSSFSSTAAQDVAAKDADATAAIYANICDMFERNVHSNNDIEVESEDVLNNDIEIDVSSLTRSEADDTLSEVFVGGGRVNQTYNIGQFVEKSEVLPQNSEIITDDNKTSEPSESSRCKRAAKVLKIPDKCFDCGKVFNYSGYLEAHKRTHSGEKPFKCQLCPRHFSQSSNLLLHQRTHTGERRFQCEICSSFFTTSSNLKAHRLTHLDRRDFDCSRCVLSFKSLRELRRHEPVHKATKDVVCDVCQKAFTKRSYLSAHIAAVHRGIRRHKCSECAKVFGNRSNLICHMRTHTGEKPFQCNQCTWKFNQSSALVRHMKKHLKSINEEGSLKSNQNPPMNSAIMSNFLPNSDLVDATRAPLTQPSNFSLLSSLPSINAIPHISNQLSVVGLNETADSTLSSTSSLHAYDFTKDGILDFSTNHQNQPPSLY